MVKGILEVDAQYVYTVLRLLKRHNPRYFKLNCELNFNLVQSLIFFLLTETRYSHLDINYNVEAEVASLVARLMKLTVHEDDPDIIRQEAAMNDDTTGTGLASTGAFSHSSDDDVEPDPVMKAVLLTTTPDPETEGKLRGVLSALYPDLRVNINKEEMVNHFTDSDVIYYDGFPLLFLFGRGLRDGKPICTAHRKKLMKHFRRNHAQDPRLLFVMCNFIMRDMAAIGTAAQAKSNLDNFTAISDMIRSRDFRHKCELAAKHPKSEEAKEVLRFVDKMMVLTGSKVNSKFQTAKKLPQTTPWQLRKNNSI
jgi:hypothetical protein